MSIIGLGNELLALTLFSFIFSLRNSLDFEQGKAFQKAEIMLQVEDTALWTGISGSRLKVSRSLLHLKTHSLPSKGSSWTLMMRTNLTTGGRHYTELLLRRIILKAKPDGSQREHLKAHPWLSWWARTACDLMTVLFQKGIWATLCWLNGNAQPSCTHSESTNNRQRLDRRTHCCTEDGGKGGKQQDGALWNPSQQTEAKNPIVL